MSAAPEASEPLRVVADAGLVDDVRQAMASLESITSYLQVRLDEVTAERDRAVGDGATAHVDLSASQAEVARLTERAEQERNRRFALEAEVDDLRSDLAAAEAEAAALRAQVEALRITQAALVTQRSELILQRARKYRSVPVPPIGDVPDDSVPLG